MEDNLAKKLPPFDSEAERAIICSMLFESDAAFYAHEHLNANDFYRPDFQLIFTAMQELIFENEPIDVITVKNNLNNLDCCKKLAV